MVVNGSEKDAAKGLVNRTLGGGGVCTNKHCPGFTI